MSRSSFGFWGAELDDVGFGRALAALGVLGADLPRFPPPDDPEKLESYLAYGLKDGEARPWGLRCEPGELMSYQTPPDASQLLRAWNETTGGVSPGLEIEPDSEGQSILPWIVQQLSQAAWSVYVRMERPHAFVRWGWPLRVGVLNRADARQLRRELRQHSWGLTLCRVETVGTGAGPSDVLILPLPLRQGLGELLRRVPRARAHCILVLGGLDEPWERAYPLVQALASQANASGVCLASTATGLWASKFTEVLYHLSHDQTLDRALRDALGAPGLVPLLFASRQLITNARVSVAARDLVQRLRRLPRGTQVPVPGNVLRYLPRGDVVKGSVPAHYLADLLADTVRDVGYFHESDAASSVAVVSAQIPELAPPPLGAPRWIQGQVYELCSEGDPQRVERALRAGARHMLVVRIGPADKQWLTAPKEAVFPEHLLPPDEERHELRVVFSEPNHAPEPQTATVVLPRQGASSTCQFAFQARTDVPTFQGRVIVLHRNRVLQTALLEGQVVVDPAQDAAAEPLRLGIEGLVRPVLEGLEARQDFALAFVANHTPENSPAVTTISEELVTFRPMGDLDDKRRKIVELLNKLAEMPDDYPKDLRHQNNVDLLWSLAFLGNALYRGIVPSQISPDRLKDLPYIQLVSASRDYLPLEFFYDLPAPKMGAKLCPNAEVALETGECAECAGLKEVPGVGAEVICPLGFWCMRLVIERQAVRADQRPELHGAPFALRCAPLPGADELKVLRGAILAASEKVDAKRGGTTQQVLNKLQDATVRHVVQVDTWDAWLKAVKDNAPSLLVLLPHTSKVHLRDLDWPQLEIGHGQRLVEAYITREHLLPSPNAMAPVVFLLGCETLAPDVGVGDFTVKFQDTGAAIVLSTLTPVLGREAGPVAEALIEHLAKTVKKGASAASNTFGYTMRTLRRQTLAQGNLMVLCLVAHGDADWRLAPVQRR